MMVIKQRSLSHLVCKTKSEILNVIVGTENNDT